MYNVYNMMTRRNSAQSTQRGWRPLTRVLRRENNVEQSHIRISFFKFDTHAY